MYVISSHSIPLGHSVYKKYVNNFLLKQIIVVEDSLSPNFF